MSSTTSNPRSSPQLQQFHPQLQDPQTRSPPLPPMASSTRRINETRRDHFPFSMTRPFRPDPTSASVVSSTAEGRAIPVDNTTAEYRTSALRELNSHYPSRYRYARSTGAQSSTYSEPVIVRSYYSPTPSRHDSSTRRRPGRSGSGLEAGGTVASVTRALPFSSKASSAGNGLLSAMGRVYSGKMPPAAAQQDTRLPPVEAFSFKSFMMNMEDPSGTSDLNSDLDKIAEICARSRYSLSNQYEAHYAPHGPGTSFLSSAKNHEPQGPTLQAVSSDDEQDMRSITRRRRQTARRNSRAMGTLETIMSSSRSSDEEKSKKRSASEVADEVRGRTAVKASGDSSPTTSSRSGQGTSNSQDGDEEPRALARRSSTSLALIDSSRQGGTVDGTALTSATALVSEPALPCTSNRQLETKTAAESESCVGSQADKFPTHADKSGHRLAKGAIPLTQNSTPSMSILSTLTSWLPWKSNTLRPKDCAEGSLRDLLRKAEVNGKRVEPTL